MNTLKPIVALALLTLLVSAPVAQASCHYCLDDVVDNCTAPGADGCTGSVVHLALHADELALELLRDP